MSTAVARTPPGARSPLRLGRYDLHEEIATGGMGSVCLGVLLGSVGFSRVVAIKRLHRHLAQDPELVAMFLDEAHLAARIRHPNVVGTIDVVHTSDELFLVMEYVDGESLAGLVKELRANGERMPLPVVSGIMGAVLRGLHAAHDATDASGNRLAIVHRDVSPHNVLVGADGVARLVDFGIAHAAVRLQSTGEGRFKGKLSYAAPELLALKSPSVASDLYSAGLVLWELAAGRKALQADTEVGLLARALAADVPPLHEVAPWLPEEFVATVVRAIQREPAHRQASAQELAAAIEAAVPPASPAVIGALVERVAAASLARRRALLRDVEASVGVAPMRPSRTPSPASDPAAAVAPVNGSHARLPESEVRPWTGPRPTLTAIEASPVTSSPVGDADATAAVSLGPGPLPSSTLAETPSTTPSPSAPRLRDRRLRTRLTRVVGVVVALAAVVLVGGWSTLRGSRAEEAAARPTTAGPALASVAAPPASAPVEAPAPSEAPEKSASPPDHAHAPTSKAPTAAISVTTKTAPRSKPKADTCVPPYTFDEHGIRRVKRECFGP